MFSGGKSFQVYVHLRNHRMLGFAQHMIAFRTLELELNCALLKTVVSSFVVFRASRRK